MEQRNIIRLDETPSTNDYLLDMIGKQPVPEGTIVIARRQTAGRGADGSAWESEAGKNLTFSMLIHPDYISVDLQFYLNKAVSLGVLDVVKKYTGDGASVKWPNDIYSGNSKVAGILIQNGIQGNKFSYCIAGVGLNVNQEAFSGDSPNPLSLKHLTGTDMDLDSLLGEVHSAITSRLELLRSGMKDVLDNDYLASLYRRNELARYIYKGEEITGRITGISRYGHLVVEIPGQKIVECDLKEIRFVI